MVMSLTKVKPFLHGVEVGVGITGVDVGVMVEVGTRMTTRVGIISMGCVGGRKYVGVDWGAHAVSVKINNKTANRLKVKNRCVMCTELKRLTDIQRRGPSSGILVSMDQPQSRAGAKKHEHPTCAYRPYNWFPKLF